MIIFWYLVVSILDDLVCSELRKLTPLSFSGFSECSKCPSHTISSPPISPFAAGAWRWNENQQPQKMAEAVVVWWKERGMVMGSKSPWEKCHCCHTLAVLGYRDVLHWAHRMRGQTLHAEGTGIDTVPILWLKQWAWLYQISKFRNMLGGGGIHL